jgi:hypothetical protein
MVQLALGVVNAVPAERRPALAEERLLFLAGEHGFAPAPTTRRDELWEAAAEVLVTVERLYSEGRLDELLCGLPPKSVAVDPLNLIDRVASRVSLHIGRDNYRALAKACVEAVGRWAQANPDIDINQNSSTKPRWELGLERALLSDRDDSEDSSFAAAGAVGRGGAASEALKSRNQPEHDVRSGWRSLG